MRRRFCGPLRYFLALGLVTALSSCAYELAEQDDVAAKSEALSFGVQPTAFINPGILPPIRPQLFPPFVSLPEDRAHRTKPVGSLAGRASVSQGSSRYEIPIRVPAGRLGVQPDVSLIYRGDDEARIAGRGWAVTGGSAVTRCQHAGQPGVPFEDRLGRFCLDGVELRATVTRVSGAWREYRTHPDARVRVVGFTTSGLPQNEPSKFRVDYADGTRATYALRENLTESGHALTWHITRYEDRHGNYMAYGYTSSGSARSGQGSVLTTIRYTGNDRTGKTANRMVEFVYERRAFPVQSAIHGTFRHNRFRVRQIRIHGPNPTDRELAYWYTLSYAPGTDELASVEWRDIHGGFLPRTLFTYERSWPVMRSGTTTFPIAEKFEWSANGGFSESEYYSLPKSLVSAPSGNKVAVLVGPHRMPVQQGWVGEQNVVLSCSPAHDPDSREVGKACTGFSYRPNETGASWEFRYVSPTAAFFRTLTLPHSAEAPSVLMKPYEADFTGDGLIDTLLFVSDEDGGTWRFHNATDAHNAWTVVEHAALALGLRLFYELRDVDADGRTELLRYDGRSVGFRVTSDGVEAVETGQYDGFDPYEGMDPGPDDRWSADHILTDLQGDGFPDKVRLTTYQVRRNDGRRFGALEGLYVRGEPWPTEYNARLSTDLNDDRRDDLAFLVCDAEPRILFYESTGRGYIERPSHRLRPTLDCEHASLATAYDPKAGVPGIVIVDWSKDDFELIYANPGVGRLVSATSGGRRTEFEYDFLSAPTYSSGDDVRSPEHGGTVVSAMRENVGGDQEVVETRYYYDHLRYDPIGGNLGFEKIRAETRVGERASRIVETTYEGHREDSQAGFVFKNLAREVASVLVDDNGNFTGTVAKFERSVQPVGVVAAVRLDGSRTTRFEGRSTAYAADPRRPLADILGDGNELGSLATSFDDFDEKALPRRISWEDDSGELRALAIEYRHDDDRWLIGLPTSSELTWPGLAPRLSRLRHEYRYHGDGTLKQQTVSGTSLQSLTTEYRYEDEGNLASTTARGMTAATTGGLENQTRVTSYSYDEDAVFVRSIRNPAGHVSWIGIHPMLGRPVIEADENRNLFHAEYDLAGRILATWSSVDDEGVVYEYGNSNAQGTAHQTEVTSASGARDVFFYDHRGRLVRHEEELPEDAVRTTARRFDAFGRLEAESLPSLDEPDAWRTMLYDDLSRSAGVAAPDGSRSSIVYLGNSVHSIDADGVYSRSRFDSRGNVIARFEALDKPGKAGLLRRDTEMIATRYTYDGVGNRVQVRDAAGYATSFVRDALGRLVELDEPNRGRRELQHNAFGDAIGTSNELYSTYTAVDQLGRPRVESGPDATRTWVWDTASRGDTGELALGRLHTVIASTGHEVTHAYDNAARETGTQESFKGVSQGVASAWDEYGRLKRTTYSPATAALNTLQVTYGYDGAHPSSVSLFYRDIIFRSPELFRVTSRDAFGVADGRLSSGATFHTERDPQSGRLEHHGVGHAMDAAYEYTPAGRLSGQVYGDYEDVFVSDGMGRVSEWTHVGTADEPTRTTYRYDNLGNISEVSGALPLNLVTGRTFGSRFAPSLIASEVDSVSTGVEYDLLGRLTAQPGLEKVEYTHFDLPKRVVGQGRSASYAYGARQERVRKTSASGTTTYLLGGAYRVTRGPNGTEHRFLIPLSDLLSAEVVHDETASRTDVRYVFRDRLGSPLNVTDLSGASLERMTFAPFGSRVDPNWLGEERPATSATALGYTGHEDEHDFGLINMRGRVFDTKTRRFLTPDPVIDSRSTQLLNPFAYVGNEPLEYVDPSGFFRQDCGEANSWTCGGGGPDAPSGAYIDLGEVFSDVADFLGIGDSGDRSPTPVSEEYHDDRVVQAINRGRIQHGVQSVSTPVRRGTDATAAPTTWWGDIKSFVRGSQNMQLALGLGTGIAAGIVPGGFLASMGFELSTFSNEEAAEFRLGLGFGETAWGLYQMAVGGVTTGGGFALATTGGGAVVGGPMIGVGSLVMADAAGDIGTGLTMMAKAVDDGAFQGSTGRPVQRPWKEGAFHGKKPGYENPGHHDPRSPNFRGGGDKTSVLPSDAREVYSRAIPDADGVHWYGRNTAGDIYIFRNGNNGKVHWAGSTATGRGVRVPRSVRRRLDSLE